MSGSGTTKAFTIRIGKGDDQLSGALGALPAAITAWYGCPPFDGAYMPRGFTSGNAADLFVIARSNAYVFYRASAYSGVTIGVGRKVTCY